MTATGTSRPERVWDLTDASTGRPVTRRRTPLSAPVSAGIGLVAVAASVAPGVDGATRWSVVAATGVVAAVVGFSAVRRRQTLLSLLLAVAGLLLPVAAVAVTVGSAIRAPAAVQSSVVTDDAVAASPGGLRASAAFSSLPAGQRTDAEAFATTLVLRLRALHGAFGPYPTSLALSNGSVVEGAGPLGGTSLGVVPARARLRYEVSRSGDAFRVTVVSIGDAHASVAATSSLVSAID